MTKHWLSDRLGMNKDFCVWTGNTKWKGVWNSECGMSSELEIEPLGIGMNYCYRCGKRLEQKGGTDERD